MKLLGKALWVMPISRENYEFSWYSFCQFSRKLLTGKYESCYDIFPRNISKLFEWKGNTFRNIWHVTSCWQDKLICKIYLGDLWFFKNRVKLKPSKELFLWKILTLHTPFPAGLPKKYPPDCNAYAPAGLHVLVIDHQLSPPPIFPIAKIWIWKEKKVR